MKLYYAEKAPNPERVMMFLKEKGAAEAVELETLNIIEGEHKSAEYRKLSPLAQMPALVLDDGRSLTESRAICRYLEGLYPEPNLMGETAEEQAFIEMWDRRVEFAWLIPLSWWVRHGHPAFTAIENQIENLAPRGEKMFKRTAQWLDQELAGRDWIAGERFTITDLTAFATLGFARVMKWKPDEDLENLHAWRGRMLERPCAG